MRHVCFPVTRNMSDIDLTMSFMEDMCGLPKEDYDVVLMPYGSENETEIVENYLLRRGMTVHTLPIGRICEDITEQLTRSGIEPPEDYHKILPQTVRTAIMEAIDSN